MAKSSLETTDIFRGAFFMCMGGDLSDIRIRNNGKQIASFLFTGPELHKHDKAYINGHALVNPVQFREALNHLRDILFENLRKNSPSSRERYAAANPSSRKRYAEIKEGTRYDRKRKDRFHQNHC